jgi:hypothetical protein
MVVAIMQAVICDSRQEQQDTGGNSQMADTKKHDNGYNINSGTEVLEAVRGCAHWTANCAVKTV